jgi:thiol-disulfide isomerase/thioredoxin
MCCSAISEQDVEDDDDGPLIREVDSEERWNALLQQPGTVLLVCKFTAPWCKPCQAIQPVYEELAAENRQVVFCTVNVDEADEEILEAVSGVAVLPTFVVMDSSHRVLQKYSGSNETKVRDLIQQAIQAVAVPEVKTKKDA